MLFYQREMNGECEYVVNGIVVWGIVAFVIEIMYFCTSKNIILHGNISKCQNKYRAVYNKPPQ